MKARWVIPSLTLSLLMAACGDDGATRVTRAALEGGDVTFARVTRITPDDASDGNQFGTAIDVDDYVVAVGAPRRKPGGAVYLFNVSGTQRRVLEGADGAGLGTAVALHDGTVAALAPDDGVGGAVHVFHDNSSGGMDRVARLAPADVVDADKFGAAIELHDRTLVVSAPGRGDGGELFVYEAETDARTSWRHVATLGSENEALGRSLALTGNWLAAGARGGGSGTVWMFERNADGDWVHAATIEAPQETQGHEFGAAIDLDGRTLVSGAAESGAVYVHAFDGERWIPSATIVPPRRIDHFGSSVALRGNRLVTGTFLSDDHVWIFEREDGDWSPTNVFGVLDTDPRPNYFGRHVAIVGDAVLAATSDPPVMRNGNIRGYRQGWIDVFRLNASPVADHLSARGPEDRLFALEFDVSEPDGESLTSEVVRPPAHGEITGEGIHLNYRGDPDYHGTDDARVAFIDPHGARTEVEVELEVVSVNDAPRGADVMIRVHPGRPTAVPIEAYDPEGDAIGILVAGKPSHGVIEGEHSPLTYTSDPTYRGHDFVQFRLSDGLDKSIVYEIQVEVVEDDENTETPDSTEDFAADNVSTPAVASSGCAVADGNSEPPGLLFFLPLMILVRRARR